jgi:hemerythrin
MDLLPWKEDYSVGIEEVDSQHKKLVEYINQLFEAMSVGKGFEALSEILNGLTEYTVKHFFTEEKHMVVYVYPDYKKHKEEHKKLVDEVAHLKKEFEAGNKKLTVEVVNFLKEWLINHINGSDKVLGEYLAQKGIS